MNNKPNLFKYAKSELSQDALIMWLIDWAKNENSKIDSNLHLVGVKFLNTLLKSKEQQYENFDQIDIRPQFNKIDIFVEIVSNKKKVALIIEDKVNSSQHSNQLPRYLTRISKSEYNHIVPVYLKTGFQHNLEDVLNEGYHYFSTIDLFEVFKYGKSLGVKNDIFFDYYDYLEWLVSMYKKDKTDFEHFSKKNINEWGWWNWIGFFNKYKREFDADWHVVPNGREKLVAFWFGGKSIKIRQDNSEYILHPYVDVKYSETSNEFLLSYRLGLNGNEYLDRKVRDTVIEKLKDKITAANIKYKYPRFKKAKETIELLKVVELEKLNEIELVNFLHKMNNSILTSE
jgi:hypothetical protein